MSDTSASSKRAAQFPSEHGFTGPVVGTPSTWHADMKDYVFPSTWMFRVVTHFLAYHLNDLPGEMEIMKHLSQDAALPVDPETGRPCGFLEKRCSQLKLVCGNTDPVFNPEFLTVALKFVRGTTYMSTREFVYRSKGLSLDTSDAEADDFVSRIPRKHIPVIGPAFKIDGKDCDFLSAYIKMVVGERRMPAPVPGHGEFVTHEGKITAWLDIDWDLEVSREKDAERERREKSAVLEKGGGELTKEERTLARALPEEVEAAVRDRVAAQRLAQDEKRYDIVPMLRDTLESIGSFNPEMVFDNDEDRKVVSELFDLDHEDPDWADKAKKALTDRTRLDPEEARVLVDITAPEYAAYMMNPDVVEKKLTIDHIFAVQANSEAFGRVLVAFAHPRHLPSILQACSERIEWMFYNGRSIYDIAAFACNAICFMRPVRMLWKEIAFGIATVILASAGCTPPIPTLSFHNAIDRDRLAWKFFTDEPSAFVNTIPTSNLSDYFRKTCRHVRSWSTAYFPDDVDGQRVMLEPVAKKFYITVQDDLYCKIWPGIRNFVAANLAEDDTETWYTKEKLLAMEKPPYRISEDGKTHIRQVDVDID